MPRKATGGKPGRPFHPELLTPSEQRVLEGVREGLHNAEIGVRLGISPDGVKFHVSNMLAKLGLSSREELARWQAPKEGTVRRFWATVPLVAKWAVGGVAVAATGGAIAFALLGRDSSDATGPLPDGLVSVSSSGEPGNGMSLPGAMSDDGRFVVFQSSATNLVPGDTNGFDDIFLRDRLKGTTTLVSRAKDGGGANGPSRDPVISRDGSHVAYVSHATNLVDLRPASQPPPAAPLVNPLIPLDVYEYDVQSGENALVSVAPDGTRGNLSSAGPSISSDGRYVAFDSIATNLVPSDTNFGKGGMEGDQLFAGDGGCDIFVRDMQAGHTARVSVASDGEEADGSSSAPAMSADGKAVAFLSDARNLDPHGPTAMRVLIYSVTTGQVTEELPAGKVDGMLLEIGRPAISDDGELIAAITRTITFRSPPGSGGDTRTIARWLGPKSDHLMNVPFNDVGNVGGLFAVLDGSGNLAALNIASAAGQSQPFASIVVVDPRSGATTAVRLAVTIDPGTAAFGPFLSGDGDSVGYGVGINGIGQVAVQRR